jgi:hypothetical protein
MFQGHDQVVTAQVRAFVEVERRKSLSDREWKHRLAGYGYDVRKSDGCLKLVPLPHEVELCDLPLERPAA